MGHEHSVGTPQQLRAGAVPSPAVGCSSGILSHKFQPWPVISPQVMVMGKDAPGRGNSSEHAFPSFGLKSQTSDEPSLLPKSSHRQHLLPAAKMRRHASAPQPRGELMAKDPSPAKDLQVWAAISGPSDSPVTGYTCHDKAVPQLWARHSLEPAETVPGPTGVVSSGVAVGCTHLVWCLWGGSAPRQTSFGPGLQALSWQVQSKAGQCPRETGPLICS